MVFAVLQLSLKAVHPFTHKEIPVIVSKETPFEFRDVLMGKYISYITILAHLLLFIMFIYFLYI